MNISSGSSLVPSGISHSLSQCFSDICHHMASQGGTYSFPCTLLPTMLFNSGGQLLWLPAQWQPQPTEEYNGVHFRAPVLIGFKWSYHQYRTFWFSTADLCYTADKYKIIMTQHYDDNVGMPLYPQITLQWRHKGPDSVSNHQFHDCLLNRLFRRRSKKTSKLRVTGLCAGNSPGTGEFPAQMASNAENVSIWWRHHEVAGFFRHLIWRRIT